MGLLAFEVGIIVDMVKDLPRPYDALSFGHPDILATPGELVPFLGTVLSPDNAGVIESRLGSPSGDIVGAARGVFSAVGAKLTVVDKRKVYGVDAVVDLNEPLPESYKRKYGLVIDPGTTEHCFNVAQALKNAAEAVSVGGYIYHMVPMASWNHGYWNFSPIAFMEFYSEENGFRVLRIEAALKRKNLTPVDTKLKFEIPNGGRNVLLMCCVQRIREVEVTYPGMQGKYQ